MSILSLQPSHSDKAANPEVLRWVTELSKLRKELKGKMASSFLTPPCFFPPTPPTQPGYLHYSSHPEPVHQSAFDSLARTQAAEVRRGLAAADPPAEQHAAKELWFAAGEEAGAGEGAQAPGGEHAGGRPEEAAGEEGRGEPARGHQGEALVRSCKLWNFIVSSWVFQD